MLNEKWKKIVNSPEASALLKLVMHIHDLCDHEGDVSEFLPTLLHQLSQLLDTQCAAVTVQDVEYKQRILARYDRGGEEIDASVIREIADHVTTSGDILREPPENIDVENLLAVPISKSGTILGTFVLINKSSGEFAEYDNIVVTLVEARMDSVIHDWLRLQEHRLVSTENRVLRELDAIRDETEEQGEALDRMIATILESVDAQIGFITLYNTEKDSHVPGGKVVRGNRPLTQKDYHTVGELIRITRKEHKTVMRHNIHKSEIDSILLVPMFISGRFLGATVLINKEDGTEFSVQDQQLVESVTRVIVNYIFQEEKLKRLMMLVGSEASKDIDEVMLGYRPDTSTGQRMKISMLFADIRNYSQLTKDMDPTTAVRMLNDFFSEVTPIVVAQGGTVDKYVGDEIVALFIHPTPGSTPEWNAVQAAMNMQETLRDVNKEWELTGRPTIKIGIGVHTGDVVLGQIGSYDRKDYTAIGANMNFAARLQSVAKAGEIIISENTFMTLNGQVTATRVGPFDIKGFGETIAYAIEGKSPELF